MSRRKILILISVLLFIALALAGTYYVHLRILEKHMSAAMDMNDNATVADLAHSFPCPVNARNKDGWTPLHWAVFGGHEDLVELLIAKGADINARHKYGGTPLLFAAGNERKETVDLLITNGADVNAKGDDGKTALQLAIEKKHDIVAELLRKAGAKE